MKTFDYFLLGASLISIIIITSLGVIMPWILIIGFTVGWFIGEAFIRMKKD